MPIPPSPPGFWVKDGPTGIKPRPGIDTVAGTIATDETDPVVGAITGIVKADGAGAISAATSGTDYAPGTSSLATGIVKSTTSTGVLSIAEAADFPTLNQNTSGTAAGLSATLAVASGGTGQTTAQAAINALTAVSGATNEHILTKDTATGNAVFKAAPAGDGHAAVTLSAGADNVLSLNTQEIGLDSQTANLVLAGPTTGEAAAPTFRGIVAADLPNTVVTSTVTGLAILPLTQAQYDALDPVVATTLYLTTDTQRIYYGTIQFA
jgi:hypothetical protein